VSHANRHNKEELQKHRSPDQGWQAWLPILSGQSAGLRPGLLRWGLWTLTWPYRLAMAVRNRHYDRPGACQTVIVPVISVGNLTTGGTGKTPLVQWVCRYLRQRQLRVGLLSRGYGAVEGGVNDEALELELSLPDVPHLQDRDRVKIAQLAIDEFESQCLVLDDGFQHRRLARDLDLVLIDATNPFGYGYTLPRGLLREPPRSLRRADAIIVTRCDLVDPPQLECLRQQLVALRRTADVPIALTIHRPTGLIDSRGRRRPVDDLRSRPVLAFAGVGNPEAFFETLRGLAGELVATRVFPDHHRYQSQDLPALRQWVQQLGKPQDDADPAGLVVTTRKDLVKLDLARLGPCDLLALEIEIQFREGQTEIEQLLDRAAKASPAG